jgi:hypothetical protein
MSSSRAKGLIITKTEKRTEIFIEHRVCCAVSSLHSAPGILWPPLTISEWMLEMRAEMHLGRCLKCPLFFPDYNKNVSGLWYFLKYPSTKFNENSLNGSEILHGYKVTDNRHSSHMWTYVKMDSNKTWASALSVDAAGNKRLTWRLTVFGDYSVSLKQVLTY